MKTEPMTDIVLHTGEQIRRDVALWRPLQFGVLL
jgi:hypothetical protein